MSLLESKKSHIGVKTGFWSFLSTGSGEVEEKNTVTWRPGECTCTLFELAGGKQTEELTEHFLPRYPNRHSFSCGVRRREPTLATLRGCGWWLFMAPNSSNLPRNDAVIPGRAQLTLLVTENPCGLRLLWPATGSSPLSPTPGRRAEEDGKCSPGLLLLEKEP